MIPFHESMFPDDITLKRSVVSVGPQGGTRRTFPEPWEEFRARVQSKTGDRVDAQGRVSMSTHWRITTSEDIAARTDDEILYLGRKLVPQVDTLPKGIGNVSWLTLCTEAE